MNLVISAETFYEAFTHTYDAILILKNEYAPDGEISDFTITDINNAAVESLLEDYTKEEIIGKKICELVPENIDQGIFEIYKNVFLTKNPYDGIHNLGNNHKIKYKYLSLKCYPQEDGVMVIHRNVSGMVKNLASLEERQNQLINISNLTSHKLRGPVATVMGLLNLFDEQHFNAPLNKKLVRLMKKSVKNIDVILKKIVDQAYFED